MRTEEEILKQINWCLLEIEGIIKYRTIPCANQEAAIRHYRGAVNNLKWVLEEDK